MKMHPSPGSSAYFKAVFAWVLLGLIGTPSLRAQNTPLTDNNFQTAVNLWFSNEATATATYGHISDWNVSGVTNLDSAFENRVSFNEDISDWDVSAVTDMNSTFMRANAFNQDIGDWNVSNVTDMGYMFDDASSFNRDIGDWDVSAVTKMGDMFDSASSFNQDIGRWDVSAVTDMNDMFEEATSFNQNIGDWNVSAVTDMDDMFDGADSLSDYHKGLIHASFSSNSNWPYDWSAYADTNATLSGTVSYSGPVTGPMVVWAFENGQKVAELTLTNGPGPYSLQLLKNRNYDVKAFRDGNGNGNLDAGWEVGEPYAHHGDWNNTTSSFNTLLLDGNKTGIDVNISWHNDHDNDGFLDWDEYVAGSEGNDSTSTPGLDYGLVAWYPFEGNASDMSGNNHHGTVNGATLGTDRYGRSNEAYSFDGNDWIDLGNVLSRYDLLSFSAWFLANSNGSSQGIVSKPRSSAGTGSALKWGGAFFNNGGSNFDLNANMGATGSWVHGALVNGGSKISVFVNGTLATHQNLSLNPVTSSESMLIGKELHSNAGAGGGGQRFFDGSIDDVRIYDRALSASEVAELYAMESALPAGSVSTAKLDLGLHKFLDGNDTIEQALPAGSVIAVKPGDPAPAGYTLFQRNEYNATLTWEEKAPVSVARYAEARAKRPARCACPSRAAACSGT